MRRDEDKAQPAFAPRGDERGVAVLVPYWSYFEEAVAGDLRASREEFLAEVTTALAEAVPLGRELWIDSAQAGLAAGEALAEDRPTAAVVVQTMAVPPAWTADALEAMPRVPVLVLAVQDRKSPSVPFNHGAVTEQGATVGASQLTSTLVRRGRPFRLVAGWLGEPAVRDALQLEARAAHAAGQLRGARLLRIGRPLEGYECVDADSDSLEEVTGIALVELESISVRAAYEEAARTELEAVRSEVEASWDVCDVEAPDSAYEASLRMAAALDQLTREHAADGGVMNCHVPEIRLGDEPGVAPCFALGRETSRGRPWTCTGDVVTAVAMLALKRLGAPAWYHEIEALDHDTDEALLASSGEHDSALVEYGCRPVLHANPWWPGMCASFSPAAGPATLVAFTVAPEAPGGFRFVAAEGEFTSRMLPETGTVNAAFRFRRRSVREAWSRWACAGANHHAAATIGHHAKTMTAIAAHIGVDCTVI
jgi:L-arabinose isomerase